MKKVYLLLLCFLLPFLAFSQYSVSGKITDSSGDPIPFTSVYLKGTQKAVSANAEGVYTLNTEKGTHIIVFKSIGFKTEEHTITVNGPMTLDQVLETESYTLQDVVIRPNAEDPAYGIIRKAIRDRKKHLEEIKSYTADVYIKGMQKLVGAPKKFFGYDVQKTLELDTNRKGILYLSESQSAFSYQRPGKVKEVMVSSKVSGRNNAFSYNKASDMLINFYENLLLEGSGLSSRSFVSPIADNGLFYYRYKLLGSSRENGSLLHKIEVTPRRKNDPAFNGIIYIVDETWRLAGANLYLTQNAGINLLDTLNISQEFTPVAAIEMPSNVKFQFKGNIFGFRFEGYFVSIFNHYNLNPHFAKDYFTAEILRINKAVNKKDSLYWMNNRPIPLTDEEKLDYRLKDSIALLKSSKPYLDSLEHANNKFKLGKLLLTGYSINNRYDKKYFYFDPLVKSIFFNSVEGPAIKYGFTYRQVLEDQRSYSISPEARYGFSNKLFTAHVMANFLYNRPKQASLSGGFGTEITDLNHYGTMSLGSNALNNLFFEANRSKFYKRAFATLSTARELADGLQASLTINYDKNYTLENTNLFTFRDLSDRSITSNNPFTPGLEIPLFPNYRSLNISASITYTIGQTYITTPTAKIYSQSKFPRIQLNYRKGFKGMLGSDVDYDLLGLEVYQNRISTGLLGYFSFVVGAGKFLNNNIVFFPESKHFRGNSSTVFPPNLRKFRYLDFYLSSTSDEYAEAHLEHNFAGFLTRKLPLIRKLKLDEIVGFNYLTQPGRKNYKEFYFGVERLGFGISYGYAFDGGRKTGQGIRIAYGL